MRSFSFVRASQFTPRAFSVFIVLQMGLQATYSTCVLNSFRYQTQFCLVSIYIFYLGVRSPYVFTVFNTCVVTLKIYLFERLAMAGNR
jgi:hypothetical protein